MNEAVNETEPIRSTMVVTAVAGAVVLVTALLASAPTVSHVEIEVFRWLNETPDPAAWPVWSVMQLGSVIGGVVGAVVVFAAMRQPRGMAAGVTSVVAAWLAAKLLKAVVDRGRPADYLVEVNTRFESVSLGQGYPSGHTAVAFALATVVAGCLVGWWKLLPFVVATVVGFGRIAFGAHFPLDVLGGAALGIGIGALHAAGLPPPDEPVRCPPWPARPNRPLSRTPGPGAADEHVRPLRRPGDGVPRRS